MPELRALSVILPCFNEPIATIVESVASLDTTARRLKLDLEIILVDDTGFSRLACRQDIADRCIIISNAINRGKGASIKAAIQRATREFVLYTDCDLPIDIEKFLTFVKTHEYAESNVLFAGNRRHESSVTFRPSRIAASRVMTSRWFEAFVWCISGGKLRDTQCPAKLMKTAMATELFAAITQDRYAFDVQLLFSALLSDVEIVEVPVVFNDLRASMSWIAAFRHTARMMKDVITHHSRTRRVTWRRS